MIAALLALVAPPHAQQPAAPVPIHELMARASYWNTRFELSLSGLLFRERYRQQRGRAANSTLGDRVIVDSGTRLVGPTRLLEANVFLLRPPGFDGFIVYRDVYRVDNRTIGDHTERLQTLLADGSASAMAQARRLTHESARHNLAGMRRNINVPTMLYAYLTPGHVRGLTVREAGREMVAGLNVVVVDFQETASPTVVRSAGKDDVPASGRFWIHPESGAVPRAMSEFTVDRDKGRLEVQLALHPALSVWVPKEMTEVWQSQGNRLVGVAQYDRIQRLSVSTNEIIK